MNRPTSRGSVFLALVAAAALPSTMLAASTHSGSPSPPEPKVAHSEISFNAPLQRKLREMAEADQRVRQGVRPPITPDQGRAMGQVDQQNEVIMKAIIAHYGWPGRSLVGSQGADDAWLIVQHCQFNFQDECLTLLERAVAAGEAPARHYAYLLDRVYIRKGWPQVYGTQFRSGVLHELQDPQHVNERRLSVGLDPLEEHLVGKKKILKPPAPSAPVPASRPAEENATPASSSLTRAP